MIRRLPKNHCHNCYFCLTKTKSFSFKQRDQIAYHNSDLAITPVPHDETMPPPMLSQDWLDAINCSANEGNFDEFISANSSDSEYYTTENPILFSQKHLNDLIRDLCVFNERAELFAPRFKEKKFKEKKKKFKKDVKVSYYRKRNRGFSSTFKVKDLFALP